MADASPHESSLARRVLHDRVQMLYRRSRIPAVMGVPFALLLLVVVWDLLPAAHLLAWFAFKVTVAAIRTALHVMYDRDENKRAEVWLRRYRWALGIDGLCWTLLGAWFARPDQVITMAILLCSLVGITAVGGVVLSLDFGALAVFSCCAIVPTALVQLSLSDRNAIFATVAMLMFLGVMLGNGRRAAKSTAELLRMRFQLVEAHEDALSAAVAKAAAHDLSAPLVAITHLSQWIRDELDDDARSRVGAHLDKLEQRVERMQQLVQGVHEYASAGRARNDVEQVDVDDLAKTVFRGVVGSDEFVLKTDALPIVATDRRALATVLRALLMNAVSHHDKAAGMIEVSAEDAPRGLTVRVSDDGPGIPERDRERVFDLLRTLQRRDEKEGAGAGLAVAKKIVDAQGGSIEVAETEGRGATIVFVWPARRALKGDAPPRT